MQCAEATEITTKDPFSNKISWLNDAIEWSNQTVQFFSQSNRPTVEYTSKRYNFSSSLLSSCQMVSVGGTF